MANPLYNSIGNPFSVIYQQMNDLQKSMNGQNPQEVVQGLLNSGQMSQADFNRFSQMANRIMAFLPK